MIQSKPCMTVTLVVVALALAGPAAAGHFLVVNDGNATACDALEGALTAGSHTFTRLTTADALLLAANDVLAAYDATFWLGIPAGAGEADWLMALMDAGGPVMVAENDFGWSMGSHPVYVTYFEATYVSDAGSDGQLTGLGIMAGIDPDISADPYPDDFTISGTNGSVIFEAPSNNAAGAIIERTVGANTYRGVYLAWDFQYTPAADLNDITDAMVGYLTGVIPVELQSFSVE